VSLFQHAASFIGVTYFGQITLLWYLLLSMIGSVDARSAADARLAAAAAAADEDAADEGEDESVDMSPDDDEILVDVPDDAIVASFRGAP
jgi:hypothetical protein